MSTMSLKNSYPDRINILNTLTSKNDLKLSELKSLAGYNSRKHILMYVEHLRKLLRQSLISLNKHERTYSITNHGKSVVKTIE